MKKLIDIIKKIDNILFLLDKVMNQEYINLLNSKSDMKELHFIIEKKHALLNQLDCAKKTQISLEKKYNTIFSALKIDELNYYSNKIKDKCVSLKKINLKNKKLIKHKFYLNQKFLNFYKSFNNNTIYDINGKL
ncbi:flagellar export chaperone FlgN [Buchnera aphidicola]|uniref:Flagellar biosynthesis protein FlgN n=1 Tax=Buchnera aphidicola (Aphis gossypii) TaxID=98785 RepID=A0A5J6ZA28_9GAMM|nr:flagellar export chaperone FlgN [Buchnera aphidicola]QFQ32160.1 flagellar biosynthesis protein FlgN [Buchnera aphidicola (Aphis gossypii)]